MVAKRPATPEDEPFLRRLFESVRAEDFAALPLPDAQRAALIDMQFRAQRSQYQANYPEASFEILELGGEPIGNFTVDRTGAETQLVDINLLPELRGQGIGTLLVQKLKDEAQVISLHVTCTNRARNLYRRLGFSEVEDNGVYVRMEWSGSSAST